MAEHVRVEVLEPRFLGASSEHLAYAVVGHVASSADPELVT